MKRGIIVLLLFLVYGTVMPQSTRQDTTKIKEKIKKGINKQAKSDTLSNEIVLEAIEIKGKVEKPGVIIMPKRIEPKLKEIKLERDFKKEIKENVVDAIDPKKELGKVDKVKSIKKTIERKRKK